MLTYNGFNNHFLDFFIKLDAVDGNKTLHTFCSETLCEELTSSTCETSVAKSAKHAFFPLSRSYPQRNKRNQLWPLNDSSMACPLPSRLFRFMLNFGGKIVVQKMLNQNITSCFKHCHRQLKRLSVLFF